MDLRTLLDFFSGRGSNAEPQAQEAPGLAALFSQTIRMPVEASAALRSEVENGLAFYQSLHESRLNMAFASFDEDMRKALFEILFLLHVNDPRLAEWRYTAMQFEKVNGVRRQVPKEVTADLYLEGAPHGVRGMGKLPAILRAPYTAYIQETFGMPGDGGGAVGSPIVSISSGGSIGTIGHKSVASDLDLNVQYDLSPFLFDPSQWSDDTFAESLAAEKLYWMERARQEQHLMPEALHDPAVAQSLNTAAQRQLGKAYPRLCRHFLKGDRIDFRLLWSESGGQLRSKLMAELMLLMKRGARIAKGNESKKQESLLRERVRRIQEYVNSKFPMTEIYLFPCSNEEFRRGRHASTLEDKESPGSAYELLLNYETVLPGIQFTSMVPTHFLFSQSLNDDHSRYSRFIDYIRFNLLDPYSACRDRLVDLGATPDLDPAYVAKHRGAVYWEAFKASSGNLPKATLNLLRFEMLLEPHLSKTSVQLLKQPQAMDDLITPVSGDGTADLKAVARDDAGLPTWVLSQMEETFPALHRDPWWLRFKALKIAFGERRGVAGLEPGERRNISKLIDLAFALHVKISDVFSKPGDTRSFDSEREKVLLDFLRRAFPEKSPRRTNLEHLFAGEVRTINQFEQDLRSLFRASLERVHAKIEKIKPGQEDTNEEFKVWKHYYQHNFEPAPNVIQRSIMNHLKVPRGRLRTGYDAKSGWVFRSLQRESGLGKRFDTFGTLDHLPDDVVLHEHPSFLGGLAHCILNGYYGTLDKGTLNERRTGLEFDASALDMGHPVHNALAFIRPDQVERVMDRVNEVFSYRPYHYLDCIRLERRVSEVFVFLNLLIFGRLSILYRDNMQTWYCDEFDHDRLLNKSEELSASPQAMMTAGPVHASLGKFFREKRIHPKRITLAAWVNPNSVKTEHASGQFVQKEKDLAATMVRTILQEHGSPTQVLLPRELPKAPATADTPPAPPARQTSGGQAAAPGDWKGKYEALMRRLGFETPAQSAKANHRHPRFRPNVEGKSLRVKSGDVAGRLINISAEGIAFFATAPLPLGKEISIDIAGKVNVRVRIARCLQQKQASGKNGAYVVDARITNREQGYRCFVLVASDLIEIRA